MRTAVVNGRTRIENLNGLRGLLAIIVCMAHARSLFNYRLEQDDNSFYFIFGWLAHSAVLCFFCLSGYYLSIL